MTSSSTSASSYRNSTAPCMTTLKFDGAPETGTITDSYSSPHYDYDSDTLYVGDDLGYLHQFTGVFAGTPAESTSPWPVQAAAAQLSSPVYESATGNVFVTTSFQASERQWRKIANGLRHLNLRGAQQRKHNCGNRNRDTVGNPGAERQWQQPDLRWKRHVRRYVKPASRCTDRGFLGRESIRIHRK